MVVNADLQRERGKATFSGGRLTNLLDGGAARTERRRQLQAVIARDPTGIFSNEGNPYLHRTERHVRALAKHVRLVELCRKLGIGDECGGQMVMSEDFATISQAAADDLPTTLHWVMFVPNIKSLCDDQQQAEWLPLCRDWKMIGCYAQTELGHGSNVRALETTATFLPESRGGQPGGSWVVNSPTLTSTKFWPGTLGRTANHAMVIAKLIDGDGVDRGIHNFLVPLRSMKDHKLLPGVTTGDLGPKVGYNNMDNGFARFENVVIPRRNMAMRFATVDPNGSYRKKSQNSAASKVAYITMMQVRCFQVGVVGRIDCVFKILYSPFVFAPQVRAYICDNAGQNLAKACTVAIRYSAVRRQGFKEDDKAEVQVLDYKQQQHRLFPLLASSYCFFFTGKKLLQKLKDIETRFSTEKPVTKAEVTDIHASSSALKSFTTTVAADGIEDCRKACGGHGYLQSSGLPELVATYLMNPTVEGDNHMLPQQVVKVLLKLFQAVVSGDDLTDYEKCDSFDLVASLKNILSGDKDVFPVNKSKDILNTDVMLQAFRHRAARLLVECAEQMEQYTGDGRSPQEAWNRSLVQMARVSRAYSQYLLLNNFFRGIDDSKSVLGLPERIVLLNLAQLFGLYWMEHEIGDFLEDGYLSHEHATWVRAGVLRVLDIIRPNAVALVDAFDYSDFILKSTLGRFDGDVYPAILKASEKDPLNKDEIGPGYEEHLKRLIVGDVGVYAGTASRL